ncbi:MAG: hypothetical protein E6R04_08700 [Spirochaetes bacterium]|nr:MAG: hypothetical protein E6R04_08700 [Spirochaetota bacterium]
MASWRPSPHGVARSVNHAIKTNPYIPDRTTATCTQLPNGTVLVTIAPPSLDIVKRLIANAQSRNYVVSSAYGVDSFIVQERRG